MSIDTTLLTSIVKQYGSCNSPNEDRFDCLFRNFILHKAHILYRKKSIPRTKFDPSELAMPLEMFGETSHQDRRRLYFRNLKLFDVLHTRVINAVMPKYYKLKVISKHNSFRKLDDLNIIVYLPKPEQELETVHEPFQLRDLIKVAVISTLMDERKILVTIDKKELPSDTNVELGRISEDILPKCVGVSGNGGCYTDYLLRSQEFNDWDFSTKMDLLVKIDHKRIYSFFEDWDKREFPKGEYAEDLVKNRRVTKSEKLHVKAFSFYNMGEVSEAINVLNESINVYPQNVDALVSRGAIYGNTNNLRKAVMDLEDALRVDPNHLQARKHLSEVLVAAAKMHRQQKNVTSAINTLEVAVKLDPDNVEANTALAALSLDSVNRDVSYEELMKKRAELNKKLKNETTTLNLGEIRNFDEHKTKCDLFLEAIRVDGKKHRIKKKHKPKHHRHHHGERKKKRLSHAHRSYHHEKHIQPVADRSS